ncbi:MAG: hypothetical protein RL328_615 [Acidobacteriota bacterium]|jgi:uncharacterized protein YdhG (YjbR/CyaY superfamily)
MPPAKSVDAYIAAQPEAARPNLDKLRATLRNALPNATEVISYGMPAYRLPEGLVIFFAGWKQHYAIYPGSGTFLAELQDELAPYEQSKGTIRFPLTKPVPVRLITKLAKARAAEVIAKAAAKKKKR